jgi:ABC-2 type transport system ATP-binding protein
MSITVTSISQSFGPQKALDNVSFDIRSGEVTGFIGPNGAGKSTMMKIITGYIPPNEGTVIVNGYNVIENPMKVREVTGYLPENNPLYTEMYVKEYLDYVAGHYHLGTRKNKRITVVIDMCGLGPEQHKKIQSLSKGYRQRVGLAQAIIHDPDVLILDEPTSGLDPNQIVEIRKLISELGKEKTLMLSTHLMQEVEAICKRIIIINKGKIVADGKPGEISASQVDDRQTIIIEFDKSPQTEDLLLIEGVQAVKHTGNNRLLIESSGLVDPRPLLFKYAVDNGLTVLSMQKQEKSIEEVFRSLTEEKK